MNINDQQGVSEDLDLVEDVHKHLTGSVLYIQCMKTDRYQCSDLPCVVVDYEALIPAVEMLMVVDLHAQFLQHRLISALPLCMHRSTYIVQDAHDAWGILGKTTQNNPA